MESRRRVGGMEVCREDEKQQRQRRRLMSSSYRLVRWSRQTNDPLSQIQYSILSFSSISLLTPLSRQVIHHPADSTHPHAHPANKAMLHLAHEEGGAAPFVCLLQPSHHSPLPLCCSLPPILLSSHMY